MIGYIAYDVELKRPGCAILQGALGGDSAFCAAFETEDWLLTPTPGLRLYPVPDQATLAQLVKITEER